MAAAYAYPHQPIGFEPWVLRPGERHDNRSRPETPAPARDPEGSRRSRDGALIVYAVPATIFDWPRLTWEDVLSTIGTILSGIGNFVSALFDW